MRITEVGSKHPRGELVRAYLRSPRLDAGFGLGGWWGASRMHPVCVAQLPLRRTGATTTEIDEVAPLAGPAPRRAIASNMLGSRLVQSQKATAAARLTADRKLRASLS